MLRLFTIASALSILACGQEPAPEWRFGVNITGLEFVLYDETEGIHPSDVVLENPNNPFRNVGISNESKFPILDEGGNAGGFYAWATLLARQPTGEHQYYTGIKLGHIWEAGLDDDDQTEIVRLMAIAAFQSVLDNFPDSVTFDPTGTIPSRLATPSYLAILALAGRPEGDWVLVETPEGGVEAVQGGNDVKPPDDDSEQDEEEEES